MGKHGREAAGAVRRGAARRARGGLRADRPGAAEEIATPAQVPGASAAASRLRRRLRLAAGIVPERKPPSAGAEPIRGELLSTERLEQFAEVLAAQHSVLPGLRRGKLLLPRLNENGRVLLASYRAIASAIREERTISPAAEWLVDNFHIVEDQIREIRQDLPPGFYRELPKLAHGPLAG